MDLAHPQPRIERKRLKDGTLVVVAAWALFALNFIPPFDNALPAIVLFGPILTGAVMWLRSWQWKLGAASWALMGLISLFWDWVLNDEDKLFHVALTVGVVVLTALGAAFGRAVVALRARRTGPGASHA
jgi:hypothetical protein